MFLKKAIPCMKKGLLHGVKVIEIAGLAPVPHCGMLLADAGAHVTLIQKSKEENETVEQRLNRGKDSIRVDLRTKEGVEIVRNMAKSSDVLLDPYRPGILEKMGLDPVQLLEDNPKLVVCRLTGYGQTGELSQEAGHDINYVALSGLLPILSGESRNPPWPPANLLADFAGGGLTAAFGIVSALFSRQNNGGQGCIVDCSMVEGLAYLGSFVSQYQDMEHLWKMPFAAFQGKCPIYRTYETKDAKFMAVGALEPKFNANLFEVLGMDHGIGDVYSDPFGTTEKMESIFKSKTQSEWVELFKGKDACVTPVLDLNNCGDFPHNAERGTFKQENGKWIPSPSPKFYTKEEFSKLKSHL